jgi:hypothetical protein
MGIAALTNGNQLYSQKLSRAPNIRGRYARPNVPADSIENRSNPRAKLGRKLRVHPSDGNEEDFEEIATSVNLSKRGMYFHSDLPGYRVGLRLFVTYPFTSLSDPMKTEWIAEVRVDELPGNKRGVAIRLHNRI